MKTLTLDQFAETHRVDDDWLAAMKASGRDVVAFEPGDAVEYAGYAGTICRHYWNGKYEVWLPGGLACVSGESCKLITQNQDKQ